MSFQGLIVVQRRDGGLEVELTRTTWLASSAHCNKSKVPLCSHVERQPDIALKLQIELHEAFDTKTSLQSLAHTFQRVGYTMKTPAPERIEQDHAEFQTLIDTHYSPVQLVLADASHFNQLTLRRPDT
ncbi:hypothetical protein EDB85DRAFT_2293938 [Lactarius pseudohatsudake]|nr:hypothetical protein EDB85DRAFT_2293938 [Lactarius pseudohatsudake]